MRLIIRPLLFAGAGLVVLYFSFIGLLTIPFLQSEVIYLNSIAQTWFQDLNIPEQWGFLHNQVTPFQLTTEDGEKLHAWHILPLELYRRHEDQLIQEEPGLVGDITQRLGFHLLRDDPSSLLVLYFHGAGGTLASGFRPPSYRALYAGAPDKIHIVAIDYRGFGSSTGLPSEEGLLIDAITLVEWAMKEAGIPSSRIVLFAQSLGTAVAISLAHHLAIQPEPVLFSGVVLVAPFVNVEYLTATYRIAGVIPLLDPIARFPYLLSFFNRFIVSKWPNRDRLAHFVQICERIQSGTARNYHIILIHAQDDYDIPWSHSQELFWHAVNASLPDETGYEEFRKEKETSTINLEAAGWNARRETKGGVLQLEVPKYGLHDRIMSYHIVSLAVFRAFNRI
ncbi:alpha/beta-hydrolase [Xylariaceae sp. FL0255]|nr:alpha/beta-hydrolase [Xylariaceae sp. FL0255]